MDFKLKDLLDPIKVTPYPELYHFTYSGISSRFKQLLNSQEISFYQGKVRQCLSKGDRLLIIHTDNLSAFDKFITNVPCKGALLSSLSRYWYEQIQDQLPTAYISSPHERILLLKKLKPVKMELVVRAYMAGSMLRAYNRGERVFCGNRLPEGIKNYEKLPELLVTPSSKAEAYAHDEERSPSQLIEEGICSEKEWDYMQNCALNLFELGSEIYRKNGWILADTKYEFGRNEQGELFVIDEIHTPDSSRLWKLEGYETRFAQGQNPIMFDKEIIRKYLISQGFQGEGGVPPIPRYLIQTFLRSYLDVNETLWKQEFTIQEGVPENIILPYFE